MILDRSLRLLPLLLVLNAIQAQEQSLDTLTPIQGKDEQGKVHKIGQHNYNVFVTGAYTPDELRQGPAPEWGIKLSISLLVPGS